MKYGYVVTLNGAIIMQREPFFIDKSIAENSVNMHKNAFFYGKINAEDVGNVVITITEA